MPIAKPHERLTHEFLKKILHYDSETGIWTWRVSRQGGVKPGDVAGCILKDHKRRIVRLLGRNLYSSVLAWFYITGQWPDREVDHKDNVKTNDRWTNLRLADRYQNMFNRGMQSNNVSGYKGVSFRKKSGKWRAQIQCRGKAIELGQFDTAEEASQRYQEARKELFGEFA